MMWGPKHLSYEEWLRDLGRRLRRDLINVYKNLKGERETSKWHEALFGDAHKKGQWAQTGTQEEHEEEQEHIQT